MLRRTASYALGASFHQKQQHSHAKLVLPERIRQRKATSIHHHASLVQLVNTQQVLEQYRFLPA